MRVWRFGEADPRLECEKPGGVQIAAEAGQTVVVARAILRRLRLHLSTL